MEVISYAQVSTLEKEIRKLDMGFGGFISLEIFPRLLC